MRTVGWLSVGIAVAVMQLGAQQPAFDVASVKPSGSPGDGWRLSTPGAVSIKGVTLDFIITLAYEVPLSFQRVKFVWSGYERILNMPFDIQAKGTGDPRAMLRTLLADRFGLRAHREIRQTPVYFLTVEDSAKLGPALRRASQSCREFITQGGKRGDAGAPSCWLTGESRNGVPLRRYAGTIGDLIERAAQPVLDRPVIDATGLVGNFEWALAIVNSRDTSAVIDAFDEQLGLKLERRTAPFEVIVIDDVRMPTAD